MEKSASIPNNYLENLAQSHKKDSLLDAILHDLESRLIGVSGKEGHYYTDKFTDDSPEESRIALFNLLGWLAQDSRWGSDSLLFTEGTEIATLVIHDSSQNRIVVFSLNYNVINISVSSSHES